MTNLCHVCDTPYSSGDAADAAAAFGGKREAEIESLPLPVDSTLRVLEPWNHSPQLAAEVINAACHVAIALAPHPPSQLQVLPTHNFIRANLTAFVHKSLHRGRLINESPQDVLTGTRMLEPAISPQLSESSQCPISNDRAFRQQTDFTFDVMDVNCDPGVVVSAEEQVVAVIALSVKHERVAVIHAVGHARKLAHLQEPEVR